MSASPNAPADPVEEKPPALTARMLALVLPPAVRDPFLGDLAEEFHDRRRREPASTARRWYRRQAVRSAGPMLRRRVHSSPPAQTLVVALLAIAAAWGWLALLNAPPMRRLLEPLAGSPLAFAVTLLELTTFGVAGAVAGRLATARPIFTALVVGSALWGWPVVAGWLATGDFRVIGGLWWAVLAVGGALAGCLAVRGLPALLHYRSPRR